MVFFTNSQKKSPNPLCGSIQGLLPSRWLLLPTCFLGLSEHLPGSQCAPQIREGGIWRWGLCCALSVCEHTTTNPLAHVVTRHGLNSKHGRGSVEHSQLAPWGGRRGS